MRAPRYRRLELRLQGSKRARLKSRVPQTLRREPFRPTGVSSSYHGERSYLAIALPAILFAGAGRLRIAAAVGSAYKCKSGREAVGKSAGNPQTAICWRLLSAQRGIIHAVFFRWFRFLCKTAGFANGARPGSFPVVLWKYLPIRRFTVATMTPTLERLFLTPGL
jgi:hypothetical protein